MIIVTIPIPPKVLHPNARHHHMVKHRAKAQYRRDVAILALEAIGGREHSPLYARANAQATFYFKQTRRRDGDNLAAWLKTAWDGLQDAGIFFDDDKLTHLPPIELRDKKERVELRIWV